MKIAFLLLMLSLVIPVYCQKKGNDSLIHKSIKLETDSLFNKLVKIRRELHENPELAGHETNTQKFIQQYLLNIGLEVRTDIYGHSVVGILKGKEKGKSIAWRAEMDALQSDFPDDVDFKSKTKGIQHGCGHDVHIAIALGIAEVLAKNKETLQGTIYFIFQPEEETFVGAKAMIDNSLFSKIRPDEIYGLHVTALPAGQIMVKQNEMFAYQRVISVKLKNVLTNLQARELTKEIHKALSRCRMGSTPWEIQKIINPTVGLANLNTIFQDYLIMDDNFNIYTKNDELYLEANLCETNQANLKNIIPTIRQLIETTYNKDKLLSISFIQENPTVINDEKLTDAAIKTIRSIYGNDSIVSDFGQVPFFNDDFAYFQQKIPGVFFFLGGSDFEKGIIAMNHAPSFKVDEACIGTAVKSFGSLIVERLK